MKKLLNTLYLTQEDYYITKEGDNIVIKQDGKTVSRFPFRIIDGVVCFSYLGASPALIKLCTENQINLSFHTPQGRFCGRYVGATNGNVLLRREHYRLADRDESLEYAKRFILAKISNARKYLLRFRRDHRDQIDGKLFEEVNGELIWALEMVQATDNKDSLRGIEGQAANQYFRIFNDLVLTDKKAFTFGGRSKRPPLDRVNALLSFGYSLLTFECQSALEAVSLDSYVGFFHTDRPGRASLALDLVEEFRSYIVDRFVFSMINKGQLTKKHFDVKENGSILLTEKGRVTFIELWQKRKHMEVEHPFTKEKVKLMLLPYVQAQLLAKAIRGDIDSYPPFMI
ncbi:type I-C CRISPR-associated endonuclease Cas1c [Streptococcus equi subsp. zooepidemicus]|uniref:type I-C CRISPR-associated endonuclease Cas1c n=1 Tax=Streptococcus equi TaxID=1336 RepID=UPI0024A98FCD|nr:type I-C CRISPR-associated endonuclease Cas1c [Streptococcus equi]MDI6043073.1 type I-C CRISPR-associated endonuclease Cas1c [Streptococcus equi subsp. zooepidemicus]HEL1117212.1 type I-C CRISPR-associated endonuclease Cas1 [Streptococcus equi subsp. zooepidemicus]HEL1170727.1 type I-C CRISPR-associated endonuclease Cas1 [Streptococcus equi subsp. zooepidemicus]HEL1222680.1 type I-C CRISPR-associated endonuclease Cas1 [Streptococcus equi subsp. zooepidemicus]